MKTLFYLTAFLASITTFSFAQAPWNLVWKMTETPFLTVESITEMGMVKAGFDTDKDGWGEFLCSWTDLDTNALLMYEATGNNTYALVWSWIIPIPINTYCSFVVGDINSNGVVDIVATLPATTASDPKPPRIFVFEWNGVTGKNDYGVKNSGTGLFDPSTSWNFDLPDNYDFRPYSLTIEDIDNDAINELIVGVRAAGTGATREIYVVSVTGSFDMFPIWETEWKYSQDFGGSLYSVSTGDLDGDGNREIYAFIWDLFTMRIFECTGNRAFTQVFSVDQFYSVQGIDYGALDAVCVTDANNDGIKEMYIAGTEPQNTIFVIAGKSDITQIDSTDIKELYTIPVTAGGKFRSMQVADPDHDGKADLMIAGEANGQIFSLEYKGSGDPADSSSWEHRIVYDIWTESGLTTISPRLFYGSPAKDMDKDGKDEYVFVNYSPDFTVWPDDSPLRMIEIDAAVGVDETGGSLPGTTELMPNFPNPFNPTTTIRYRLTDRVQVTMTVFDVLGKAVAVLVDREQNAGEYSARFDASSLPSGMYFCRLTAGSFVDVKKMMLLK